MPFVQVSRKRRRHEDDDGSVPLYDLQRANQEAFFLNHHHNLPPPRKVLPLKRARLHDDEQTNNTLHKRRPSYEHVANPTSTKPRDSLLAPCHICQRHPTRRAHLDAFAHCQACGQWTCYICIRQCNGVYGGSAVLEQEALSRSFQMHDGENDDDDVHTTDDAAPKDQSSWTAASGHRSIVCRSCCVEQTELAGEVACWACHLALDSDDG